MDSGTAWAAVFDVLVKTGYGGWSWSERPAGGFISPGGRLAASSIAAASTVTAWAAGRDIAKTADGGATWNAQYAGAAGTVVMDVSAADASVAWALVNDMSVQRLLYGYVVTFSNGRFLKTADGGATWVTQPAPGSYPLWDIEAVDPCRAWASGGQTTGVVLRTGEGGDASPDVLVTAPQQGAVGSEVMVMGCDFGADRGSSFVSFGDVPASERSSWSDFVITARVPAVAAGEAAVKVTTLGGTSNPVGFRVYDPLSVASISPARGAQNTIWLDVSLQGTGFQPGAKVRLEKGGAVSEAFNLKRASDNEVACTVGLFGLKPGSYDVVVTCPDGQEARLAGGFTVTSMCGAGSGAALLALGVSLGLLSLAGTAGARRRKRRR